MSPKKKAQILSAIASFGDAGVTVSTLARTLKVCDSGVARYVLELRRAGEVAQMGVTEATRAPIYIVSSGAEVPAGIDIFEQCRATWQGYRIHKIFGSARAAN